MSHIDAVLLLSKQIALSPNEELQSMRIVLHYLRQPFVQRVIEGFRIGQREADEEDISVWVGKRSKAFVLVLTSGVPEPKFEELMLVFDSGEIIVEYCRDVIVGKSIGGVADEQRCFANTAVSDKHHLDRHCVVI